MKEHLIINKIDKVIQADIPDNWKISVIRDLIKGWRTD